MQEAIAARSYWHPNGFVKLVLTADPRAGQLRLHIWPEPPTTDDIHGHAWSYESIVLTGELTEVVYRESRPGEGQPMWRHSYGGIGQRRFALLDPTPVYLAQASGPFVHAPGDESGGSRSHIHRFIASRTPAATMLRVGPVLATSSAVYRLTAEPQQIVAPRAATGADVRDWVAFLTERIDA